MNGKTSDDDLLPVIDLDICLDPGLPEQFFTIWPEDEMVIHDNGDIAIELRQSIPGRPAYEAVLIRSAHIRWYSERHMQRKLPKWPEVPHDVQGVPISVPAMWDRR